METEDKIAILLCTYNGETYLKEQIDSILSQSYRNWYIFVSDDGSTDNTCNILDEYQKKIGCEKLKVIKGPQKGFAQNFMTLIRSVPKEYEFYAFCDQDDIWLEEKIAIAIGTLKADVIKTPKVYCGRTTLVDENNNIIGESPLFIKKPGLRNALVQSIAGGNTMVLTQEAFNIVSETPRQCDIVSHDWWVYILITAAGGRIYYDPKSTIHYRQHTQNLVGSNTGWFARLVRLKGLMKGKLKGWSQRNIEALLLMDSYLTKDNRNILNSFIVGRNSGLLKRTRTLVKLKLYRQTKTGTIALLIAILLNKI